MEGTTSVRDSSTPETRFAEGEVTTSPALKSVRDSSTPEAWVAVEDFEWLANIEQVVSVAQRAVRDPQARVAGGVEAE